MQELEDLGVIRGYRAILDRDALNRNFLAYVTVGLSNHGIKSHKEFEKVMQDAVEVTECHNVAGAFEYLLRVEVKSTNYGIFYGITDSNPLQSIDYYQ